jgi:hypothetical protein
LQLENIDDKNMAMSITFNIRFIINRRRLPSAITWGT